MWKTLVLVAFISSALGDNSYMLVVPRVLRPGIPVDIAVNILNATRDVHVRALVFKDNSYDLVLNAEGSFREGEAGTLTLSVPSIERLPSSAEHFTLAIHGSGGLTFNDQTYLTYQKKDISVFVQTDKAVYKPGQKVQFRVVAVYSNMTIYDGPLDVVIRDSTGNKIKQWLGVNDESGVFEGNLMLDTEPTMGFWAVAVDVPGGNTEKSFEVKEYVLPKFDVKLDLPEFTLTTDTDIQGRVKATYTYGKPVKGNGTLIVKLDYYYSDWGYYGLKIIAQQTFNITGDHSFTIPLDVIHELLPLTYDPLSSRLPGYNLKFEVNVTEEQNQLTVTDSSDVVFREDGLELTFLPSSLPVFKPGLPYRAHVQIGYPDGRPIVGHREDLTLKAYVTYHFFYDAKNPERYYAKAYSLPESTVTVPESGIIDSIINIPDNATNVRVEVKYGSVEKYKDLTMAPSPSGSYLHLELKSSSVVQAGEKISFEVRSTKPLSSLMYQVISRGSVVLAGTVDGALTKSIEFSFVVTKAMGPKAHVFIYYIGEDEEIVADGIEISVEDIFENHVTIGFDKSSAEPGDIVNLDIRTSPQSVVNLLAVDQSVILLKSGNDITRSTVTDELINYTPEYYHDWRCSKGSPECVFNEAGVWIVTDVKGFPTPDYKSFRPQECDSNEMNRAMDFDGGMAGAGFAQRSGAAPMHRSSPVRMSSPPRASKSSPVQAVARTRQEFPETWLWMNKTVGNDGRVTVSITAPDTITSWVASAFSVNKVSGLGIADTTAKLKTFRSFFVSLNLPYSVVRGEDIALQAVVFNYLTADVHVALTLEGSTDFVSLDNTGQPIGSQDRTKRLFIKAGEAKSSYFPILPTTIGKIDISVKARTASAADAVKRQLLVEPEGVAKEENIPILVDLRNASQFTEVVPITLPSNRVEGSEKIRLTAMGDIMGPSVNGLGNLLRMPRGTGDKAMLSFAPNVYIADYLSATKQFTDELKAKTLNYLARGYQHVLSYKRYDGAFRSYGSEASTWLTALVLKSFSEAQRYIFIDDQVLKRSEKWLLQQQTHEGSFEPRDYREMKQTYYQGKQGQQRPVYQSIQDSEVGPVALTGYVLIALNKSHTSKDHAIKPVPTPESHKRAMNYLARQLPGIDDAYGLAITSYALALTGSTYAHMAITKLNDRSILKNGKRFWRTDSKRLMERNKRSIIPRPPLPPLPPVDKPSPVDIEIAAYALLTHAHNKDFASGRPVMKWLMAQRNAQGGFLSAHDTVVGLEALSEFAKMSSDSVDIDATIQSSDFTQRFQINDDNAMVSQSVMPISIPKVINVTATGHGVALIEATLFYNVDQDIQNPAFDLKLNIPKETQNVLTLNICASWRTTGSSGMIVMELGVLSGFEPDRNMKEPVTDLIKIVPKNRKLIMYFEKIGNRLPTCFDIDMYRVGMVGKPKAASVLIYQYYQPGNQASAFYQSELLKDSSVCGLCGTCCSG